MRLYLALLSLVTVFTIFLCLTALAMAPAISGQTVVVP